MPPSVTRLRWVLGILLVAATLLWANRLLQPDPAAPRGPSELGQDASPATPHGAAGPTDLPTWDPGGSSGDEAIPLAAVESEEPGDQGTAAVVEAVVAVPHVMRDSNADRSFVDPAWLEQRYAGADLQQLMDARIALEGQVTSGMNEAAEAFFASGRGEEHIVPGGDPFGPKEPRRSNGLIGVRRSEPLADGSRRVLTGELPWELYSELYDAKDELYWLMAEIRHRSQPAPAATVSSDGPGSRAPPRPRHWATKPPSTGRVTPFT